jgi:hypothetical protein
MSSNDTFAVAALDAALEHEWTMFVASLGRRGELTDAQVGRLAQLLLRERLRLLDLHDRALAAMRR